MILPRRLMKLEDGSFCEEDDPKQAMNFRPKGFPIPDPEAEKIGLKAYLDRTGWGEKADDKKMTEAKAVTPAESEDKSSESTSTGEELPGTGGEPPSDPSGADKLNALGPGLHIDPESRRSRRTERA